MKNVSLRSLKIKKMSRYEHHNKDTGLLEMEIRQHNKYRVKEDLTERQRMFCDILRDADKVDIFKVNADIHSYGDYI